MHHRYNTSVSVCTRLPPTVSNNVRYRLIRMMTSLSYTYWILWVVIFFTHYLLSVCVCENNGLLNLQHNILQYSNILLCENRGRRIFQAKERTGSIRLVISVQSNICEGVRAT